MNWEESFVEYAIQISKLYKQNPEETISSLGFLSVAESLNETYQCLVGAGEIKKIEDIEQSGKDRLWSKAIGIVTDKKHRILISRSIYLLEQLTK